MVTSVQTQVQLSLQFVKPHERCEGAGAEAAWMTCFIASSPEVGAAEQVGGKMLLATITGVSTQGVAVWHLSSVIGYTRGAKTFFIKAAKACAALFTQAVTLN